MSIPPVRWRAARPRDCFHYNTPAREAPSFCDIFLARRTKKGRGRPKCAGQWVGAPADEAGNSELFHEVLFKGMTGARSGDSDDRRPRPTGRASAREGLLAQRVQGGLLVRAKERVDDVARAGDVVYALFGPDEQTALYALGEETFAR